MQDAVKPEMKPAEALAARRAIMAKIEQGIARRKTGLRSDVVTLYQGGQYHLYRYKKYTDVRLVMAPEHRHRLLRRRRRQLRVSALQPRRLLLPRLRGRQARSRRRTTSSGAPTGPKDGDLVFVTGHPGTTNRLETLAKLQHRRDVTLPYTLQLLRYREALLSQFAEKGPEQRRLAQRDLFRSPTPARRSPASIRACSTRPSWQQKLQVGERPASQRTCKRS